MGIRQARWDDILLKLETEKRRIFAEILNYPPPIPACDVQFNHLLDQRAHILEELERARAAAAESLEREEDIREIAAFIAASRFLLAEEDLPKEG